VPLDLMYYAVLDVYLRLILDRVERCIENLKLLIICVA